MMNANSRLILKKAPVTVSALPSRAPMAWIAVTVTMARLAATGSDIEGNSPCK